MFSYIMGNSEAKGSEDDDDETMFEQGEDSLWTARRYFDTEEDEYFTEFHHVYQSNPIEVTCVDRAIRVLRQLRHPNILKYVSSVSEPGASFLWAESVVPLSALLAHLSGVEAVAGIRDIARGIEFMHEKAHVVHCNLHLGAIFVSEKTWLWKVAGMEAACARDKLDAQFLSSVSSVLDPSTVPPEDTPPVKPNQLSIPPARDIWALGQLITSIDLELGDTESLPPELLEYATADMMDPDPTERPTVSEVLAHPTTHNLFTKVVDFFQDITTKTDTEKMAFCSKVPSQLTSLPEEAISHRLLPVLLSPAIMGDSALDQIWEWVLVPRSDSEEMMATPQKGLFSKDCYEQEVLPRLITLFQSRKSHVRLILLQHMEYYAELCSEDILDDIILPETLIGLHEEDDLLVAATLKGLGVLVTLLGAEVVMGTQRKNVFSDSRPALTASGLGRVKTSGSVSTEGSGLLRAPDKPLPLPRQEAGADMIAPGMSKEERRQLRHEEQERRRQQRLAQKVERERGPKLLSSSHDVDSSLLEDRHDVMEPWDSPHSGPFDDEATEETPNSQLDEFGQGQTEDREGEGSASDYDQSKEAEEKASNEGWDDFEDWGDNATFDVDTDEPAAPLLTPDPPQTHVAQNTGSLIEHCTSRVPSQLEESRSMRESTSSQSGCALLSPSEAFDTWQTGTGRISQRDAERISRQSKLQLLEPDYFADMAPQV